MPLLSDQMKARLKDLEKIKKAYYESLNVFEELAKNNKLLKEPRNNEDAVIQVNEPVFKITNEYLHLVSMVEFLTKNYEEALFMNTAMATYIGGTSQEKEFADFFQIFQEKPKQKKTTAKAKKSASNVVKLKPNKKESKK